MLWMGEWLPKTPGLSQVEVVTHACLLMGVHASEEVGAVTQDRRGKGAEAHWSLPGPMAGLWWELMGLT